MKIPTSTVHLLVLFVGGASAFFAPKPIGGVTMCKPSLKRGRVGVAAGDLPAAGDARGEPKTTNGTGAIARQPPRGKRMHLVTDPGFARSFLRSLLFLVAGGAAVVRTPPLYQSAVNLYAGINEALLSGAHRMAWWSVLGLLSSSCCALQIILNALSMGCAGFNTVLGPARPFLLAVTAVVQTGSWYVASSRPWQAGPTAAATALVVGLAFLPEVLALGVHLGERRRRHRSRTRETNEVGGETLVFQLDSMGCVSCVSTVSNVLDGIPEVADHKVSLEDGVATVRLPSQSEKGGDDSNRSVERIAESIVEKLEAAGFPATRLDTLPSGVDHGQKAKKVD